MPAWNRRAFLFGAGAVAIGARQPVIVLRNGWQSVNVGDIAHTPGMLQLLEKHLSEARVTLVSSGLSDEARAMLQRRFPSVRIVSRTDPDTLREVYTGADFFLHGSGPSIVALEHLRLWAAATTKPFGVFGVTVPAAAEAASSPIGGPVLEILNRASFFYTRETESLQNARNAGLTVSRLQFVPDTTFSMSLRDDEAAGRFLKSTGLAGTRFLAVIPRLRYTPYHKFQKTNWTEQEKQRRDTANAATAPEDAAKLREVIIAWVRKSRGRALLCAEMTYQLELLRPLLYDPLPEDVRKQVVVRETFWLPDEAAAVFAQAEGVVSSECHSPIMAAVQGVPCFYARQPEDGIKGQMWADLGLGDWAPMIDRTSPAALAQLVLKALERRQSARAKVQSAVQKAQALQADGIKAVRSALSGNA